MARVTSTNDVDWLFEQRYKKNAIKLKERDVYKQKRMGYRFSRRIACDNQSPVSSTTVGEI